MKLVSLDRWNVMLRRLLLAMSVVALANAADAATPNASLGGGTTGGRGGEHVMVRTGAELEDALCRGHGKASACTDATPRIVEVVGTIDFRGTEGTATSPGCYYDRNNPRKALLATVDPKHACTGPGLVEQPISYDKAGTHPLLVGSNKTIIGRDASAVIKGRGLALRHVQNVIVRNLTITDINPAVIWAGDALDLSDVKDVWIDHNLFSLVGRQMIVGHFGGQRNVTLSWNVFDGRTPFYAQGHYWNILFTDDQPTDVVIAYNWFRDFSGRAPDLHGQGAFHIVNNLFQNGNGHALEVGNSVDVLLEGNDFENVLQPIVKSGGSLYAPMQGSAGQDACSATVHRTCEGNRVVGARSVAGFGTDAATLTAFTGRDLLVPRRADAIFPIVTSGAGPGRTALP